MTFAVGNFDFCFVFFQICSTQIASVHWCISALVFIAVGFDVFSKIQNFFCPAVSKCAFVDVAVDQHCTDIADASDVSSARHCCR